MQIDVSSDYIDITKGDRTIRIAGNQIMYVRDVVIDFDHIFASVVTNLDFLDFSKPGYFHVTGFDDYSLLLPHYTESVESIKPYLEFAQLKPGDVVLDLGAFAGIASILFMRAVGYTGRVIAVEADPVKIHCIQDNAYHVQETRSGHIDILEAAVWEHNNGIEFSSDGTMGASASEIVGKRGTVTKVCTVTLSRIAELYKLAKVDFIKCDIEGAERVAFKDHKFFARYRPRVLVETHGEEATKQVKDIMRLNNYDVTERKQPESRFLLLECVPC